MCPVLEELSRRGMVVSRISEERVVFGGMVMCHASNWALMEERAIRVASPNQRHVSTTSGRMMCSGVGGEVKRRRGQR